MSDNPTVQHTAFELCFGGDQRGPGANVTPDGSMHPRQVAMHQLLQNPSSTNDSMSHRVTTASTGSPRPETQNLSSGDDAMPSSSGVTDKVLVISCKLRDSPINAPQSFKLSENVRNNWEQDGDLSMGQMPTEDSSPPTLPGIGNSSSASVSKHIAPVDEQEVRNTRADRSEVPGTASTSVDPCPRSSADLEKNAMDVFFDKNPRGLTLAKEGVQNHKASVLQNGLPWHMQSLPGDVGLDVRLKGWSPVEVRTLLDENEDSWSITPINKEASEQFKGFDTSSENLAPDAVLLTGPAPLPYVVAPNGPCGTFRLKHDDPSKLTKHAPQKTSPRSLPASLPASKNEEPADRVPQTKRSLSPLARKETNGSPKRSASGSGILRLKRTDNVQNSVPVAATEAASEVDSFPESHVDSHRTATVTTATTTASPAAPAAPTTPAARRASRKSRGRHPFYPSSAAPTTRVPRRAPRQTRGPHPSRADNAILLTAYLHNWSYRRMSEEAVLVRHRTYDQIKQHFMNLQRSSEVGPGPKAADKGGRRWATLKLMQKRGVEEEFKERDGKAWAVDE
ncbi:hypothetical protein P171DRAFT_444715 [Karstenula rhodostoma CBS 690.94]|uniref:Uncharacterized protein n=1 Tax=Karstenula rhodostoma CBS 690.94 TaxID=1392251 RepID=A0A9P4PKG3_9PLEO|nr:hypothetical protein P171DRAFT_444715 [Karstenula rhodostoma CBS 690.94]